MNFDFKVFDHVSLLYDRYVQDRNRGHAGLRNIKTYREVIQTRDVEKGHARACKKTRRSENWAARTVEKPSIGLGGPL